MNVIFFRHGIAEDMHESGDDFKRRLTETGKLKTGETARGLKFLSVKPDLICTSPLIRTRQTAEIIRDTLSPTSHVTQTDVLAPQGTPQQIINWLSNRKKSCVLMVGHMPNLAEAVSFFCTGSPDTDILFKKAAACQCSFSGKPTPGKARLDWLMQPKQLRRLIC